MLFRQNSVVHVILLQSRDEVAIQRTAAEPGCVRSAVRGWGKWPGAEAAGLRGQGVRVRVQ